MRKLQAFSLQAISIVDIKKADESTSPSLPGNIPISNSQNDILNTFSVVFLAIFFAQRTSVNQQSFCRTSLMAPALCVLPSEHISNILIYSNCFFIPKWFIMNCIAQGPATKKRFISKGEFLFLEVEIWVNIYIRMRLQADRHPQRESCFDLSLTVCVCRTHTTAGKLLPATFCLSFAGTSSSVYLTSTPPANTGFQERGQKEAVHPSSSSPLN